MIALRCFWILAVAAKMIEADPELSKVPVTGSIPDFFMLALFVMAAVSLIYLFYSWLMMRRGKDVDIAFLEFGHPSLVRRSTAAGEIDIVPYMSDVQQDLLATMDTPIHCLPEKAIHIYNFAAVFGDKIPLLTGQVEDIKELVHTTAGKLEEQEEIVKRATEKRDQMKHDYTTRCTQLKELTVERTTLQSITKTIEMKAFATADAYKDMLNQKYDLELKCTVLIPGSQYGKIWMKYHGNGKIEVSCNGGKSLLFTKYDREKELKLSSRALNASKYVNLKVTSIEAPAKFGPITFPLMIRSFEEVLIRDITKTGATFTALIDGIAIHELANTRFFVNGIRVASFQATRNMPVHVRLETSAAVGEQIARSYVMGSSERSFPIHLKYDMND